MPYQQNYTQDNVKIETESHCQGNDGCIGAMLFAIHFHG